MQWPGAVDGRPGCSLTSVPEWLQPAVGVVPSRRVQSQGLGSLFARADRAKNKDGLAPCDLVCALHRTEFLGARGGSAGDARRAAKGKDGRALKTAIWICKALD